MEEYENAYREGKVGDVAVKRRLVAVLNTLLEPIRARRKHYQARPDSIVGALRTGTIRTHTARSTRSRPRLRGS